LLTQRELLFIFCLPAWALLLKNFCGGEAARNTKKKKRKSISRKN